MPPAQQPSPGPAAASRSRQRVIVEAVTPQVDGGRFPAKRCLGEDVVVEADVFADGHDVVSATVLHRRESEAAWCETRMAPLVNDRFRAAFPLASLETHRFTVVGWVDAFATWLADLRKRVDAGQDVAIELRVGADLLGAAAKRARRANAMEDAALLASAAAVLRAGGPEAVAAAAGPALVEASVRHPDRRFATTFERELVVTVDRERAGFAAWYEVFPRSIWAGGGARRRRDVRAAAKASRVADSGSDSGSDSNLDPDPDPVWGPGAHGTLASLTDRLPAIAEMGFDVVYLPPIHPIGRTNRKGRNNQETAEPGDPGSPWAIGAAEGGHDAIHPDLGTLREFHTLVRRAHELGMEIALDLALQASPDHPWVREHPEWFAHRPDGSIRYAENPPKIYQDIYPLDFGTPAWESLWREVHRVVRFWIEQGVRTFRVDNPHTKPFALWEWLIAEVRRDHPDVVFLAEAFTRPKVMRRLAKIGFTQSYTYFAWRTEGWELIEYLTELTQSEMVEYYRPSLWPNTPDILTAYLVDAGRPAFVARLVLAATLGSLYGIYGPAFELMEREPREPGSEEYLDSEKYQIRIWDRSDASSLVPLVTRINEIRRGNPALHGIRSLRFSGTTNDRIICYHKRTEDRSNVILVFVNLDPVNRHSCITDLWMQELGLEEDEPFVVHDLLTGERYPWIGRRNFVELDPTKMPAHVFRVERAPSARAAAGRRSQRP